MTDERDRRKFPHRDHARSDTPRAGVRTVGPPAFGGVTGECDSDDRARMAEHFEDDTPVEVLKRIERKLPDTTVQVDPHAFDPDVRWAQFEEMRTEVAACKQERLKREKWKRWVFGGQFLGGGSVIALVVWAVTKIDAKAQADAEERQRVREHQQLLINVRSLEDWRIGIDILMGLRRRDDNEPARTSP